MKCEIFSASFKGICSYFPSIGETSVIAGGDENLLRQTKVNPSEVPAAVIPRLCLVWHHSSQSPLSFCLSVFLRLFPSVLFLRMPPFPGATGR